MKRPTNRLLNWVAAAVVVAVVAACGGQTPVEVDNTLSVTIAGDGTGTVISVPAGIDVASGTETADFAAGTEVELTATATGGSTFTGWTGDCTGTGTCSVTLDDDVSVTATFAAPVVTGPFEVTLNAAGSGEGTVTSDVTGFGLAVGETLDTVEVDAGTVVTLTAAAEAGSIFAGWTGDCTGVETCVVTVNADTEVTASFVLEADATSATFQILQGSDDAEEYLDAANDANPSFPQGSVDLTSSDLDLTYDTANVFGTDPAVQRGSVAVGLRYGDVAIPQGAVITSAAITFTRDSNSGSTVTFLIEGQAADDAGTFVYNIVTPANFDITSRPATTATVSWTTSTLSTAEVVTDDVAAIVQEIVDREGWASGNAMVFRITSEDSSAINVLRAESFEGGTPAVLSVTYVTPVAP